TRGTAHPDGEGGRGVRGARPRSENAPAVGGTARSGRRARRGPPRRARGEGPAHSGGVAGRRAGEVHRRWHLVRPAGGRPDHRGLDRTRRRGGAGTAPLGRVLVEAGSPWRGLSQGFLGLAPPVGDLPVLAEIEALVF